MPRLLPDQPVFAFDAILPRLQKSLTYVLVYASIMDVYAHDKTGVSACFYCVASISLSSRFRSLHIKHSDSKVELISPGDRGKRSSGCFTLNTGDTSLRGA